MGMFDWVDEVVNNVMSADTEIGINISSAPDLTAKIGAINASISTQPLDITTNIKDVFPFDSDLTQLTVENTDGIFNTARDILNALGTAENVPSNFDSPIDMANAVASAILGGDPINDVLLSGEFGGIQFETSIADAIDATQSFMNNPTSAVSDLSSAFVSGIEGVVDQNLKTVLKFMGDAAIDELSSLSSPETLSMLNSALDIANNVSSQKDVMQQIFDNLQLPELDPLKWASSVLKQKADEANTISFEIADIQLSIDW